MTKTLKFLELGLKCSIKKDETQVCEQGKRDDAENIETRQKHSPHAEEEEDPAHRLDF